ncbi:MAG: RHS repeat-associated core domain-containing protein, partial [Bacteroides xylanisolvens]
LRYGQTSQTGYGLIDNLNLVYNGNQLQSVNDNATNSVYGNGMEFRDGANQVVEYEYDKNGNITKDLNKKIADIQYNILNLPSQITFEDRNSVKYLYNANGVKLRTESILNGDTQITDYCGNAVYENGALKMLLNEAGYVSLPNEIFHFYLKDHLGNVRVVADEDGHTEEANDYYPFGGLFTAAANVQPYKYNGKELDTKNGLDWYDYGARHYDATIGRWHVVDPMSEKYCGISPYVYCGNNPINRIDPDGREWKEKVDEEIAKQLQQQIASRDKSLAKQESKINAKIEKIENNTKLSEEKKTQQIARQQGKLENVQAQRTVLSNLDKGITQLGDSKTSYTFSTVGTGTTATLSSMSDGTIVINNYGTTGNRAHETTHAIQYDNGKIRFNPLGSNNALMQNPQALEIEAYATEYSITNGIVPSSDAKYPRTIFGINVQWLNGVKDPITGNYPYRLSNYK